MQRSLSFGVRDELAAMGPAHSYGRVRTSDIMNTDESIARRLGVPIYQLLGGKVRDKVKVYSWIGGHRPAEVEEAA